MNSQYPIGETIKFMDIPIATITEAEVKGNIAVCKVKAEPGWEKRVATMTDMNDQIAIKVSS